MDSVTVKGKDLWPKAYKDGTYVTIYDSVKYIDIDHQPYYWLMYFYEYSVHFKGIWNREEEVIYSVTEEGKPPYYVHTFIKRPTYTLTARSKNDTIEYNSENIIDVTSEVNECKSDIIGVPRNRGGLNDEVLFTARIVEGSQYGELYTEKVQGDQIQTDNLDVSRGIYFRTEGSQNPDSVALVRVEISCYDIDVSPSTVFIEFYVKNNLNRPPEMKITFDKNVLSPWDSTAIHLQKLTSDGQIVDFPPDQLFNIKITDGTDFGILYSEGEGYYSNEFQYVGQEGLWFYSFDTLEDTTKIKIYVETFEEEGNPATSIIGTNLKEKSSSTIKPAFINPGENKISGYGEILIVKSGGRLNIRFDKNPISPGDTTRIIIEGIDQSGNQITFPPEQLFYLEIWSGWNYGSLYSLATGQNGKYIEYAPREFFFIANDSLDVDTAEVEIYVETEYGTAGGSPLIIKGNSTNGNVYKSLSYLNKKLKKMKQATENKITLNKTSSSPNSVTSAKLLSGIGKLRVVKNDSLKIKITLTGPNEIWPLLPSSQNNLSGYNPRTNIKVSVTRGTQSVVNESVELSITRIEGTGGHDHTNPPLPAEKSGSIKCNGLKGNPITVNTDQNGEIITEEILASEFGGEYIIKAKLVSNEIISDTVHYSVRVPGLELLSAGTGYIKTGGTVRHYGPPNYQTDNNHWVSQNASADLKLAATNFSNDRQNKTGAMRINDISLPYGGLFDHLATWEPPHFSHRIGRDVDIENRNITVLLRFMSRFGWRYIKEPGNFYPHFRYVR